MTILGFDTAGHDLGVCLYRDGELVTGNRDSEPRGHAEQLVVALQEILAQTGTAWNDLDAVACMEGPGSFTGLRIGMATAKGISLGNGVPVISVPTLEAIAQSALYGNPGLSVAGQVFVPLIDARKNRFYAAVFSVGADGILHREIEDRDETPGAVRESAGQYENGIFCGPGTERFLAHWRDSDVIAGYRTLPLVHSVEGLVLAATGRLTRGETDLPEKGPFYLRESDVGTKKNPPRFG